MADKMKAEVPAEERRLCKNALKSLYDATLALKTVIIDPFRREVLNSPEFVTWLDECVSYTIKKVNDVNIAELVLPTVARGDAAFSDLKQQGITVEHPCMRTKLSETYVPGDSAKSVFLEKSKKAEPQDDFWSRFLVIEGLSPEATSDEEALVELFPEAINILAFKYDPHSEGILGLEFLSEAGVDAYIKKCKNNQLVVNGETGQVSKYANKMAQFEKIKDKSISNKEGKLKFVNEDLDDQRRLEVHESIKRLNDQAHFMSNNEELFGEEKLAKFYTCLDESREMKRLLCKDTRRRLIRKMNFPEPKEDMHVFVKEIIKNHKGFVGSVDQNKVLKQLEDYDKEYLETLEKAEKLRHKIHSTEGQLEEKEKIKRRKKLGDNFVSDKKPATKTFDFSGANKGKFNNANPNQGKFSNFNKGKFDKKPFGQQKVASLMDVSVGKTGGPPMKRFANDQRKAGPPPKRFATDTSMFSTVRKQQAVDPFLSKGFPMPPPSGGPLLSEPSLIAATKFRSGGFLVSGNNSQQGPMSLLPKPVTSEPSNRRGGGRGTFSAGGQGRGGVGAGRGGRGGTGAGRGANHNNFGGMGRGNVQGRFASDGKDSQVPSLMAGLSGGHPNLSQQYMHGQGGSAMGGGYSNMDEQTLAMVSARKKAKQGYTGMNRGRGGLMGTRGFSFAPEENSVALNSIFG